MLKEDLASALGLLFFVVLAGMGILFGTTLHHSSFDSEEASVPPDYVPVGQRPMHLEDYKRRSKHYV